MWRIRVLGSIVAAFTFAAAAQAGSVTMDALWPNEDGREWRFNQHFINFQTPSENVDNGVRILFDGTTIAPNGIAAQYLRQELVWGPASALELPDGVGSPFLRQLSLARPDLRAAIVARVVGHPCPDNHPAGGYTVLMGGEFACLKTATEIAAWRCNLADTRSWKWLESNLTLGSTFTLQLIPDLATDVLLHGEVAAVEDVVVPAGTFTGCVRMDYLIDYGLTECVDNDGNPAGTSRSETRGSVYFAPDVGPVSSIEEFVPIAELTGTCEPGYPVGQPITQASLELASPTVAVRPTTWGRLKTLYR